MAKELEKGKVYEANPYPASLPPLPSERQDDPMVGHQAEIVEILRDQHNLNQFGEATTPWEFMTELSSEPLVHVGAIGRFLHPDYGVIQARYVQFTEPGDMDDEWQTCVGYVARLVKEQFRWGCTTKFELSHPKRAVGLLASYVQPKEGQYGWAIIDGVNLKRIKYYNDLDQPPKLGERIIWRDDDSFMAGASGDLIGTIVNLDSLFYISPGYYEIAPGAVQVQVTTQGIGEFDISDGLSDEELAAIIAAVKAALNLTSYAEISGALVRLSDRLGIEERAREVGDANTSNKVADLILANEDRLEQEIAIRARAEVNRNELQIAIDGLALALNRAKTDLGDRVDRERVINLAQDGRLQTLEFRTGIVSQIPVVMPTLTYPFQNYGTPFAPIRYRRLASNMVVIDGAYQLIDYGPGFPTTSVDHGLLFTLELGYRPEYFFSQTVIRDDGFGSVQIHTNGEVWVYGAKLNWNQFPTITFIAPE